MKKIFLFSWVVMVSASVCFAQGGGCVAPPAGLVSWWRGEGNALDSAGRNDGALLVGNTRFGSGAVGQGFVFDGDVDVVVVGNPTNLQLQNFTIEAWIQRASSTNVSVHSSDAEFFSYGYAFGITNDGRIFLSKEGVSSIMPSAGLTDTNFHHVAVTKSGSMVVFYVDGVAFNVPPYDPGFVFYTGSWGAIGARGFDASFLGTIDELSIYNHALASNDIAAIYSAGSAGKCSGPILPFIIPPSILVHPTNRTVYAGQPTTFIVSANGDPPLFYQWLFEGVPLDHQTNAALSLFNPQLTDAGNYSVTVSNAADSVTSSNALLTVNPLPPCTPPPDGLVSWWRFQNDLLDSWDSNNGTAPFGNLFVDGKVGQAINETFQSPHRLVLVPDSPSLQFSNALTIEAWVKEFNEPTNPVTRTIVSKFDSVLSQPLANQSSFFLGTTNNGQVCFVISSNGLARTNVTLITSQFIPSNTWTFVVATYDGAAMRIYLNGALAAQSNYSNGIFMGTDNLGIGAVPLPSSNFTSPFFGAIDEVSIYNRALSNSEIASIYNSDLAGKCLVAPTITAQPLSQLIPQNEDVKFSVSVLGLRPLKYQWRFDGQNIIGATNATLILEKLKTNNIGFYTVLVSNSVGSVVSSDAALKLSPPLGCTPLPAGAISWWPADNSKLDAVDGNNGQGGLLNPAGKVNQTFFFNGVIGDAGAVVVNNSASLNFGASSNFSVEVWIKALPPAPQRYLYPNTPILEKGLLGDVTGVGYSLLLNQGRLACWLGTNAPNLISNSAIFISPEPDLRDGMFHHVAVTLDRSSTTGGKLFVDGNVVLTFNAFSRRGDLSNTGQLFIGGPTSATSNSLFYGSIDELAIYNRALSTNEIQAIAGAGSAGKCRVAPFILIQPTNQIVNAGSNATFSVVAGGNPNLRYQWFLSTSPPVGVPISGATNSTYVFTNVRPPAGEFFFVRVTNFFGFVTSSSARLTVTATSPPANGLLEFGMTGGQPLLQFTGVAGQQYLVQSSTNLADWAVIGTATDLGDGSFEFVDPDWTNYSACFYRIVLP
jgi:hypothetical protein